MAREHAVDGDTFDSKSFEHDISHNMLAGSLYRNELDPALTDGRLQITDGQGRIWTNREVTAQIVNTTMGAHLTQLGQTDKEWQERGAVSMDAMHLPYTTSYSVSQIKGLNEENLKTFGDKYRPMASFEKPGSIVDDKGNEISLSHYGNAGSGVPDSSTLNPYLHGHSIIAVNRASGPDKIDSDITIKKGGYGTAPKLGEIKSEHQIAAEASRPVSLRGPMVLTGWGYDLYGFPTPNAKWDAERREANPDSEFWGLPRDVPVDYIHDKPDLHHIPRHLGRPDQYKAGPIDLRWDRDRKVWTGGRYNGIYLCKATKCILPKAGADGKNSFNFGISNNIASLGRLYRNPCPSDKCEYWMYFPKSKLYPDIEIYDPEDKNWCGNCSVKQDADKNFYVDCDDMVKACVPFYDALILRSTDHVTDGANNKIECGDKFYKTANGSPYGKRMGDPCHGWGDTRDYTTDKESLVDKVIGTGNRGVGEPTQLAGPEPYPSPQTPSPTVVDAPPTFSETALPLLYRKILIENPLNQGLMLGDNFLSYDTGRTVVVEYTQSNAESVCTQNGEPITVKEVIPIHIILQAEFYGMEIISHAGCEQGEMSACTRKFFAQGFVTMEDCGPDDDYPLTAIR